MTYEEIVLLKERDHFSFKKDKDTKKPFGKNWESIMSSTDKLLWFFMISEKKENPEIENERKE